MAITVSSQDSGATGSFNPSFTTGSATAGANKLQLLYLRGTRSAVDPQTPSDVANGANKMALIGSVGYHSTSAPIKRLFVYRYLGSSFTGGWTVTVAAPGWTSASWSWMEFDGIDTSGTNGAGAIVQSGSTAGGGVTSFTIDLANITSSNNALVGGYGSANNTDDFTVGTNFTLMHNISDATFGRVQTEYAIPGDSDGDVDGSWGASKTFGAFGVEIQVATTSTSTGTTTIPGRRLALLGVS